MVAVSLPLYTSSRRSGGVTRQHGASCNEGTKWHIDESSKTNSTYFIVGLCCWDTAAHGSRMLSTE